MTIKPKPDDPATGVIKILSEKLGLMPHMGKPSHTIRLKHRAVPLPMPGSHAALVRRLYGLDRAHQQQYDRATGELHDDPNAKE